MRMGSPWPEAGERLKIGRKSLRRMAFVPTDVLQPRFDSVQTHGDLIELGGDPVGFCACDAAPGGFDER